MTRAFTFIALAVTFSVASAQSGISSNCTQTLAQVAANADASSCLSPTSLVSLITGSANNSIIGPIDTWLNNVCGAPACSNSTLSAVVTNLTAGCSTELSALGFESGQTATIISTVQSFYPTVRKVACLKDGNTNCITETLTNIQDIVGNLSLTNIASLVSSGDASLPSNVTCTNCVKAAYNTINTDFPGLLSSEASTLQQQCGTSFTDGSSPSNIVESASTASAGSASSAAMSSTTFISGKAMIGVGASALITLGSFFTFLA